MTKEQAFKETNETQDYYEEQINRTAQREQIMYQIENLDESTDKVFLNGEITEYNNWANKVNADKQVWGWFSWYRDFDMGNHLIIKLV